MRRVPAPFLAATVIVGDLSCEPRAGVDTTSLTGVWVAPDLASYITSASIVADGGVTVLR